MFEIIASQKNECIYTNQPRPPILAKTTQGWDHQTINNDKAMMSVSRPLKQVVEQNYPIYGVVA